jgi:hypothetical protein
MFVVLPCCVLNLQVIWTLSTCKFWSLPSCPNLVSYFKASGNIPDSSVIRRNFFDFLVEIGKVGSQFSQIFKINFFLLSCSSNCWICFFYSSLFIYIGLNHIKMGWNVNLVCWGVKDTGLHFLLFIFFVEIEHPFLYFFLPPLILDPQI